MSLFKVLLLALSINASVVQADAAADSRDISESSDPKNPVEVARMGIPSGARSIRVSGSLAYVGNTEGVTAFDMSDPKSTKKVGHQKTPAIADRMWLSDTKVYVAARQAGLTILKYRYPIALKYPLKNSCI